MDNNFHFIKQIALNYTNLEDILSKLENSDFLSFESFGHTVIGINDGGVKKNPHLSQILRYARYFECELCNFNNKDGTCYNFRT